MIKKFLPQFSAGVRPRVGMLAYLLSDFLIAIPIYDLAIGLHRPYHWLKGRWLVLLRFRILLLVSNRDLLLTLIPQASEHLVRAVKIILTAGKSAGLQNESTHEILTSWVQHMPNSSRVNTNIRSL